jgi:hypothetical protein
VQVAGCRAVHRLASKLPRAKAAFGDLRLYCIVLNNLRAFVRSPACQAQALDALSVLVWEQAENRDGVGEAGGNELLVQSVRAFKNDPALVTKAITTIAFLACKSKANTDKLLAADAPEALVEAGKQLATEVR